MNVALRNFPKPPLATVNADCGLSERREIVARLCDRTNEVLEYCFGLESSKVLVPGQSNIDERMPLCFLRPCVEYINTIIQTQGIDTPLLAMLGNSMDYHQFVPLTREIAKTLNAIIEEL